MAEKIVLIDGHSILNRAFFGLPDLTNGEGIHTGAVYGFLNIMFKILEEEKPEYLTVAFDVHAPTFRHKMYAPYKGTRKPMAEELRQQVPLIKEMLTAMQISIVEKEGYEADDVLGTIAVQCEKKGLEVSLISGDRDLLQLATNHIKIRIPKTKRTGTEIENYYAADVKDRYQVTPLQFIDVKALMGDTADNIPGVPGIGEKTATNLIAQFGSIEEAYTHVDEITPNRAKENLKAHYDLAVLSKTLATIDTNAPITHDLNQAAYRNPYTNEAYLLCKRLEFKNLLGRFAVETPQTDFVDTFLTISDFDETEHFFEELKKESLIGVDVAVDGNEILGIAVSTEKHTAYIEPGGFCTPSYLCSKLDETTHCKKAVGALKEKFLFLSDREVSHYIDVELAAYLLNPLKSTYPYEDIAKDMLGIFVPSRTDLLGKAPLKKAMEQTPDAVRRTACLQAYVNYKAAPVLLERLEEKQMSDLFYDIEMPLTLTLFDMEQAGIYMDADALEEYGKMLSLKITELEGRIYEEAGEKFNINSPKQLGEILFEKLGLPGARKTKTGYSTAADVLERLAPDSPLVSDVLSYRGLTKLKSTYADGLLHCVGNDGRVHSTFHQTITATGRISSTDPNLQNIPVRMELGREIRKVFLPADGFVFLDADYSQIELRVLAHLSGDQQLIEAYQNAQDIHRMTASQVFHVPFDEVTDLQRRNAKAVNFGIVYGISSFGLSQDLSISRKEAAQYIERYFEAYPVMHDYLTGLVEQAKKDGFVRTMFGRIRPVPELSSSNYMQRSFGERVAMNSPIQGTAADIIKIAMVRVHDRLKSEGKKSRLILQVHDELLIETALDELDEVSAILKEEMEQAAALKVKLEVDMHTGKNWYEAK